MSNFKSLVFYPQIGSSDSDCFWLSRNVDFIFSCVLVKESAKSRRVRKLCVMLGKGEEGWDGLVDSGVANVRVRFPLEAVPQENPEQFQKQLCLAAYRAIESISGVEELTVSAREVTEAVLATGLVYEHVLVKSIKNYCSRTRFSLSLETSFGRVCLLLTEVGGQRMKFRLLETWPSPWLMLMMFCRAEILGSGELLIELRGATTPGNQEKFGIRVVDARASELPVHVEIVQDSSSGAEVSRFRFALH